MGSTTIPMAADNGAFAQFQLFIVPVCLCLFVVAVFMHRKAFQNGAQGAPTATGSGAATSAAAPRPRTRDEVARHNTRDDCWLIIDGNVYDVTSYIDQHPGEDSILNDAGGDASAGFHGEQHPDSVHEMIPSFYVGDLVDGKKDE